MWLTFTNQLVSFYKCVQSLHSFHKAAKKLTESLKSSDYIISTSALCKRLKLLKIRYS